MPSVEERNEVAIVAIRGIGSSSAYRPPERVEAAFCELRLYGVLQSSHRASVNGIIIAVERGSPCFGVEAGTEEIKMPLYMVQFAYTSDAWAALVDTQEDRSVAIASVAATMD